MQSIKRPRRRDRTTPRRIRHAATPAAAAPGAPAPEVALTSPFDVIKGADQIPAENDRFEGWPDLDAALRAEIDAARDAYGLAAPGPAEHHELSTTCHDTESSISGYFPYLGVRTQAITVICGTWLVRASATMSSERAILLDGAPHDCFSTKRVVTPTSVTWGPWPEPKAPAATVTVAPIALARLRRDPSGSKLDVSGVELEAVSDDFAAAVLAAHR